MRFCVSYGNHGNGIHVEDVLVYIRNSLRAAGREAYLLPTLLKDEINIVLECFAREQVDQIRWLKRHTQTRFIVVVSEFTDGTTFNSHITSGEGHYVQKEMWQSRFNNFLDVAAVSEAVWSISEFGASQYKPLFPDKPVLRFPIGFDPLFPQPYRPDPRGKDIDLLFTGNETPYRKAIIEKLANKHYVVTLPVTTPNSSRVDAISRCKASLHINLSPNQSYSSVMRHHFLIMNACTVVSERAKFAGTLDEFVAQFEPHDFVERVSDYLESERWKSAGLEAYNRYRNSRPLDWEVKSLLEETDLQ